MTPRYFADETLYLALYHDVLGPNGDFKESNMEDLGEVKIHIPHLFQFFKTQLVILEDLAFNV